LAAGFLAEEDLVAFGMMVLYPLFGAFTRDS